ncbi:hypothetical protein [Actinacidiphila oryziradicis]|uniref:hypothetical protein n=1 Tax=Actinacidiphila oryziradicis TaxID=2571141 RepID=UPI001B80E2E2|nr:hypothetical protein [Actinacidiphila oryziradicis]
MDEVRRPLEAFAAQMLGSLSRRDQQAKGELYLRGLSGRPVSVRWPRRLRMPW